MLWNGLYDAMALLEVERLRRSAKARMTTIKIVPTTQPITMPAIAPRPIPLDEEGDAVVRVVDWEDTDPYP